MQVAIRESCPNFNTAKSRTRESAQVVLQCLTSGNALSPEPSVGGEGCGQRLGRDRVRRSKQSARFEHAHYLGQGAIQILGDKDIVEAILSEQDRKSVV